LNNRDFEIWVISY